MLLPLMGAASAQHAVFTGKVVDAQKQAIEMANIAITGTPVGTVSDADGFFSLRIPAGKQLSVSVSFVGYHTETIHLHLAPGESFHSVILLQAAVTDLPDVEVLDRQILSAGIHRLDPRLTVKLPGPTRAVEALIKTLPGVSTTTELSAQYNVRGGNFDENLVYVEGIEIYRPFLIRSGQQEGLSFINPDLVSDIRFSAGGFDAMYGDKMASVLDIRYRDPESFSGTLSASLLEGSLHLENRSENKKFSFLGGIRYKSNQYLLGTLDVQGDYRPSFTDIQGLINYRFNDRLRIFFLGNYSHNTYRFVPTVQRTRFGTVADVRELTVYFDGQEKDQFIHSLGALSLVYTPADQLKLRFTGSMFRSNEREHFDILGQYWLYQVETDFGEDDFGQPVGNPLGVGSFLNHARNNLNALVWNLEHQGKWGGDDSDMRWGFKYQREDFVDRLNEWSMIDSSGYSLPRHPPGHILLQDTLHTTISLLSSRISGFVQHTRAWETGHGRFLATAGVRSSFWNLNRQWTLSPRTSLLYKPHWLSNWVFRAAAGYYHQPPFYRELRDFQGRLNRQIRAQESIHFVLGSEYFFRAWDRPFKYTTEVYYKYLSNLIPYELDNVRIRYYADNLARGYAAGVDLKLHGEFVPGVDSWVSLSLLKTQEKIEGTGSMGSPGEQMAGRYIPRPTDQRLNFSMFFQDFLPRNPTYQVQLGFIYGSGLPFGPPGWDRQGDTLRMPSYKRVDIGFSKQLIGEQTSLSSDHPLRHLQSLWLTAEVFNLLEINNTISYMWIRDVENRQFAVPNHLTSRLINVKLIARF